MKKRSPISLSFTVFQQLSLLVKNQKDLSLMPVLEKWTEPTIEKFLTKIISIIKISLKESGLEKEISSFINEKVKEHPHYTDNNKASRILFCSSHFGVGKSTILVEYAGKLAINYLNTMGGDFPVFIELKNVNQDTDIEEYVRVHQKLELKTSSNM